MLLAFDIGNSHIVIGVFKERTLVDNFRLETDTRKSADEYGMIIRNLFSYRGLEMEEVDDVIISTVVPSLMYTLQHMSIKYFGKTPIVIASGIKTGLVIKYSDPRQVGADRIINAVAAIHKYGGPLIIIDFGTATTFCAVTDKGEYLGGSIAPGLQISSDALVENTAMLPKVELELPGRTICKNTNESMQSGLVYGHIGLCEYMVAKMKEELREYCGDKEITVVATGGLSSLVQSGSTCIDVVDKMLTLEGLELIYEKNRRPSKKSKKLELLDEDI